MQKLITLCCKNIPGIKRVGKMLAQAYAMKTIAHIHYPAVTYLKFSI